MSKKAMKLSAFQLRRDFKDTETEKSHHCFRRAANEIPYVYYIVYYGSKSRKMVSHVWIKMVSTQCDIIFLPISSQFAML